MKYIWRKIKVGFWKETIRWVVIAPTQWFAKTNLEFDEKVESVNDEWSIWQISDTLDNYNVKRWGEGWIDGNLWIESIWLPLLSLLWEVTSTETIWWGAYNHLYSLSNNNSHPSLTITIEEDNHSYAYPLSMIESLTITANVWEIANVSITFKSKKWETTVNTVTHEVDYYLLARHFTFITAENYVDLDSWTPICVKGFSITFSKNLFDDYCNWSIEPVDFLNQQFWIEFTLDFDYDNETYKNYALDWIKRAVRILMVDTDKIIWNSDNPTLKIDLAKVWFTDWSRSKSNDEIVNQTLTWKSHYSQADSLNIEVELTNETISY